SGPTGATGAPGPTGASGPAGATGTGSGIIDQGGPPERGGFAGGGKGFGSDAAMAASTRTTVDRSANQGPRGDRPVQVSDETSERWSDAFLGEAPSLTIPLDHTSLLRSPHIALPSN